MPNVKAFRKDESVSSIQEPYSMLVAESQKTGFLKTPHEHGYLIVG